MSNWLENTLPHLPLPPPPFSLCHCDVTRALTCEIEQSSQPKHTHLDNELCGERVALTAHIHTHTHTDVSTCEVLLSPSHSLSVCHSLSFFLFLTKGLSFKMAYKWNCWKIKNRSRHFVFHATRRLIIKTDFYMQRQCQRNVCYRHTQSYTHTHTQCEWVCSVQFSRVEFASFRFGWAHKICKISCNVFISVYI